ncbi:hypothetical protein [Saccharothrix sp. ST-888]|uniref:hypothetical protein n=1 Tax=Saccharothrix sp. ST-888 TaxID=1427391 RepID=UPI0005EC73D9|nr:hypothetical protein [Saccharothrix sp. ST-888]KJK56773.1 hypothetical protein UK12_20700 [Saccharothrix sp. ST-888]
MRDDKLDLTQEENTLNDRRAELYFAWARSEEAKNATAIKQLTERIQCLTAQLADRENKLAAADRLIVSLRPPQAR